MHCATESLVDLGKLLRAEFAVGIDCLPGGLPSGRTAFRVDCLLGGLLGGGLL